MRRYLASLGLTLVLGGPWALGAHSPGPQGSRSTFFPVAVWYGGGHARAPMLEPVTPDSSRIWLEDLQKIKSLGFNTVRTWVEWSSAEPREGEYHFEQLELMLRLAEQSGLKVIVQVYADSAPDWVGRKFPDARFVAQNGEAIPSQAAPGFCFDHPGVRQAMLGFFRETARRATGSAALFAWDLWSEPHVINWAEINYIPNASFCYCPSSLERFRNWLEQKYGALEALNAAWYRRFNAWSEVEPPRFGTILSYSDYMDWRSFTTSKLAEDLAMRRGAIRQVDALHVTTSHSAVPQVFTTPASGDGTPDDWAMNRAVDYYGTSFYPKHSIPSGHWSLARRALAMDFAASAAGEKGFYVGELQAGFGVRGVVVGEPVTPEDLALYTWGMVARGAKAICYYAFYPMSSGYESGGYGLIHLDGTLSERSRRAGETARAIEGNADLILDARRPRAQAALLFNPMTTLVGGEQNAGNRLAMRDSASGYHRMFFERNVPLDFLHASYITAEELRSYRLVIVPYPILLTETLADLLAQYVRDGGHLFVEARPGWVDDRGHAQPTIPGFGWDKMLGVREESVRPRAEFNLRWGDQQFAGATFEERFSPQDRESRGVAFFEDDSPAAYERKYGRGSAIVLGAFAGQINESKPAAMHPLGQILIRWAGLATPSLIVSAPVELQLLEGRRGMFVFIFNHGQQAAKVEYTSKLDHQPASIREILTNATPSAAGLGVDLKCEVPPQSVRIFRIDYRTPN